MLRAGAATVDVTPRASTFLFGYPHVPRMSTGTHDPLEGAALYLESGDARLLFLANDVIFVSKAQTAEIRRRIFHRTGIPEKAIMVTATHTHSGPAMIDYVSNAADPVVPPADAAYIEFFIEQAVGAAEKAVRDAVSAEIGYARARADGIGTNRHDPAGPSDLDIPVLAVRSVETKAPIGCMLVCAMHPTVLHEDSTLFSADFPYFTREYLRRQPQWARCPVLFHQGASGNQSPRHVTRANTFAEAQRIGEILGRAIEAAIAEVPYQSRAALGVRRTLLELTAREFPSPERADREVVAARTRFAQLKKEGASRQAVRTAECDLFGAQETAELARAAKDGRLSSAIAACLPAEIQAMTIGPWTFAGWPGEFFVEYALELRRRAPGTFVVTMANGELQGYIVTEEAAARGGYEASNAVFSAANGRRFVEATLALREIGK
jgi:Neutral/alkaline non-lysosomal ceramidase.